MSRSDAMTAAAPVDWNDRYDDYDAGYFERDTYDIPYCTGCDILLDESDEIRTCEPRQYWGSGDFQGQTLRYHDNPTCGCFVYEIACKCADDGCWHPADEIGDDYYDYPPY